jgi:hypothetical protein
MFFTGIDNILNVVLVPFFRINLTENVQSQEHLTNLSARYPSSPRD